MRLFLFGLLFTGIACGLTVSFAEARAVSDVASNIAEKGVNAQTSSSSCTLPLTILYRETEVSAGVKAESSIDLIVGKSKAAPKEPVILTVRINPSVSDGLVTYQYSKDGGNWVDITSGRPVDGVFTYLWAPDSQGTYTIRATWSGNDAYEASTSKTATLTVTLTLTKIAVTAPAEAKLDETIQVTATLTDDEGNPIIGATVTFKLGSKFESILPSKEIGKELTDSSGTATIRYKINVSAETYALSASYDGSTGYSSSKKETTLTVNPWKLTITSNAPQVSLLTFNDVSFATDPSGSIVILVFASGTYTLTVSSPLSVSEGTRLLFVKWGDDVTDTTRSITIDSNKTLSVVVKKQHSLTVTSPYGTPRGAGWYDVGVIVTASVELPAEGSAGTRHIVTGFTGTGSAPASDTKATVTFNLNSPSTVTFSWKTQHSLSLTSQYGSLEGEGWYDAGSKVKFTVQQLVAGGEGVRYVFKGWNGVGVGSYTGNSNVAEVVMNNPVSERADWRTEFYVKVESPHGNPTGEGWHEAGSKVSSSVTSPVAVDGGTRHVVVSYEVAGAAQSGTGSSVSFSVSAPSSVKWAWKTQYLITVKISVEASGAEVASEKAGSEWFDSGVKTEFPVPLEVAVGEGVRSIFKAWREFEGSSNKLSLTVQAPRDLTVVYTLQFLLTISSAYGEPKGGGWHDAGSTAQFVVTSPWPAGAGERFVAVKYEDGAVGEGASGRVVMDSAKKVSYVWKKQYLLSVNNGGHGSVSGSGWYDEGSTVTFELKGSPELGGQGVRYVFDRWVGTGASSIRSSEQSAKVTLTSAVVQTAVWRSQFLVSFDFLNARGERGILPEHVKIKDSRGDVVSLSKYSDVWLDQGSVEVISVVWRGVNVAPLGFSAVVDASRTVPVSTRVYPAKVAVKDMAGLPVVGASVSATTLGGELIQGSTDSGGAMDLLIPLGKYAASVSYLGQKVSVEGDVSSVVEVSVQVPVGPFTLGGMLVPAGLGVAVMVVRLRVISGRRGALTGVEEEVPVKKEKAGDKAKHISMVAEGEMEGESILSEKASRVAHSPVHSVLPDDNVAKAKDLMKAHGYSQIPVMKDGVCVGCVTDASLVDAIGRLRSLEAAYDSPVSSVMGDPFPILGEDTPVSMLIPLITQHRAVLVSRKGVIVGIVTAFDILR